MQPTQEEEWRIVSNHVGYEVSDCGRVRSWRNPGKAAGLAASPHLLKPTSTKHGHLYTTLAEPRRKEYVHVLVAAAFIGPRPTGMQVAHGDGNGSNNRVGNLRYATPTGNSLDRNAHGTMLRGEQVHGATLTADLVTRIRDEYGPHARYRKGLVTQRYLAAKYGLRQTHIQRIVSGRAWAHLFDDDIDDIAARMDKLIGGDEG